MTVPDPSWSWRLGLHAQDLDANGHDIHATGSDAITPFYIPVGETFTVPTNRQSLFHAAITVDGALVVDGLLIGV